MSKRLEGKRVVVTQASTFMGPAITEVFAEEGAVLVADDRDLTQRDAAQNLIDEAGHVDVLIANLAAVPPWNSVAPHNVQVNAVAQSLVENPSCFTPEYIETPEFKERLKSVPAGRLVTAREDALFVLFLAGDESDFFVGQIFPFAGGWAT